MLKHNLLNISRLLYNMLMNPGIWKVTFILKFLVCLRFLQIIAAVRMCEILNNPPTALWDKQFLFLTCGRASLIPQSEASYSPRIPQHCREKKRKDDVFPPHILLLAVMQEKNGKDSRKISSRFSGKAGISYGTVLPRYCGRNIFSS